MPSVPELKLTCAYIYCLTQYTMPKFETKNQSGEHFAHDDKTYPPFKIVLPAMAAIWLAFFVVALVRTARLTGKA
jgi:hypothetical protein